MGVDGEGGGSRGEKEEEEEEQTWKCGKLVKRRPHGLQHGGVMMESNGLVECLNVLQSKLEHFK